MDINELRKQEYIALRKEVDGQQWRSFLTVIIGLLGMPTLGYFLLGAQTQVWLILPLLVLVLIMLYLVQQNEMMRVGRYIRERLEPEGDGLGWETWLESRTEYRRMETQFSRWFIIIFFTYFALALGIAIYRLYIAASEDPSGMNWRYFYGAMGAYGITTLFAIMTVMAHWRTAVSTQVDS